jgi:hypothetical protein
VSALTAADLRQRLEAGFDARALSPELVVFIANAKVVGRGSGAEAETEIATVFEFAGPICARCETFASHAQALAAAEARDA